MVARRISKDHILQVIGVTNVDISHDMVLAAQSARSKYSQYLSQKKEEQECRNEKNEGQRHQSIT